MNSVNAVNSDTPEAKLHFLDYWRVIRMRKTVILAVFLLVVITTTVITFFLPEVYSSSVRIAVEKGMTDVKGIDQSQNYQPYDPIWLQTEFEKLKSQSILDQVITNKDLDLLKKWTRELSPDGSPLRIEEARLYLKHMIDVRQARNTSLIEIVVYSRDKKEAADIAQTIAEVYRDSRVRARQEQGERGIEKLKAKVAEKDDEFHKAQEEVNKMRKDNNIPDMGDESSLLGSATLYKETLRRIEAQRVEAELEFNRASNLLGSITNLSREKMKRALPTAQTAGDSELVSLLESLDLSEQKLIAAKTDLAPAHPEVIKNQAIVDKINEQIQNKIDGILVGLRARVDDAKGNLTALEAAVEKARAQDIELAAKFNPYFRAKRDLEDLQKVRNVLKMRIDAELVDLALPTSQSVVVTDKAEPGLRPVKPQKTLNIALGVIIGLIIGVGLAFFIEYLDTSVKTIDDVERSLQAPVLAVIPQNVGSLLEEGQESPHAEAYRVLRTNILFSRKDDKLNTVSVISGGAGEGKSTTLFNLAVIFAQNGSRVLIVDSDLRRPSLHKILHVSNATGLTNYLLNQQALEQVIQTTPQAGLDFLPSGKLPSSSMGVLSSSKMKDLIGELKRRYDFVFFDSPPIMGVSDGSILASQVDMVLQVIQYRRYPQPMTLRAKQMIQKVGGNLIGLVLNNINMSSDENYYYYSGYYYDYYSKQDDDGPVEKNASSKNGAKSVAKTEIKQRF